MVAAACGLLVLVATRDGFRLAPDSITYLSVADHLRSGRGLTDFTGDELTVFGPVLPLLLAPGGSSVVWARIVAGACVAASVLLMHALLRGRVPASVAIGAAAVLGASESLQLMAASSFSETPYIALSLATFVVLDRSPAGGRGAALAGALAGLGFATRYAGVGLVAAGAVVVLLAGRERSAALRRFAAFAGAAGAVGGAWVLHNLVAAGQPLGPRFEGGASEDLWVLLRRPFASTGAVVLGEPLDEPLATVVGIVVVALLVLAGVLAAVRRPIATTDVGIAVFAVASVAVPVAARAMTSNDISPRVMSPMLVPLVYTAATAVSRLPRPRLGVTVGALVGVASIWQGVQLVDRVPDLGSSGSRTVYSAQLHDLVDDLPDDALVLTNNPWGVWWVNRVEPTLFAFTRPRAGNSHFPLDVDETLAAACTGRAHLAWFSTLRNAGDGPAERRPDLLEVVELELVRSVPGGDLYRLAPLAGCTEVRS